MKFLDREATDRPRSISTRRRRALPRLQQPALRRGILVMLNARLFKFWHDLPDALRTGKPQNEIKHGQKECSRSLRGTAPARTVHGCDDGSFPDQLRAFAPSSISQDSRSSATSARDRPALHRSREEASASPLRLVRSPARRTDRPQAHRRAGLSDRITRPPVISSKTRCQGGPHHDGHDSPRLESGEEDAPHPRGLRCLPPGGALVAIEALIDDARRENVFGYLCR